MTDRLRDAPETSIGVRTRDVDPRPTKLTDAGWEPRYDPRETPEEATSCYVETDDRPEAVSLD